MVTLWLRYRYVRLRYGYVKSILWLRVTLWLHYVMVTLRLCYGYNMVTDYIMATLRLHHEYIIVPLWLHYC